MFAGRLEQDTIWLDISEGILKGDMGLLKHGVVGSWKTLPVRDPIVIEMEAWVKKAWRIKGQISFHPLN